MSTKLDPWTMCSSCASSEITLAMASRRHELPATAAASHVFCMPRTHSRICCRFKGSQQRQNQ
eukprot:788485-Pyramimonas_sp.AAC.1